MFKPFFFLLAVLALPLVSEASPGDFIPTFGDNGISALAYNNQNGECAVVSRLSDGRILTGSTVQTSPSQFHVVVTRLLENGSLDTSFGVDGNVLLSGITGTTVQTASAVALLQRSDDRIAVAVAVAGGAAVRILTSDGVEVPTQAINYTSLPSGRLTCALMTSQDRLLLGGVQKSSVSATDDDGWIARFHAAGGIDTSFGNSGKHTFGGTGNQGVHCLAIGRDGVLFVGGFSGNDAVLRRQSSFNGNLFTSPNTLSFRNTAVAFPYVARAIHFDSIGRPVVVASTTTDPGQPIAARFRLNFSLDTAFASNGIALLNTANYPQMLKVIGSTLLGDDRLLVAGLVATSPTETTIASRLIQKEGNPDATFGGSGWAAHTPFRHSSFAAIGAGLPRHNEGYLIPGWWEASSAPNNRQAVAQIEAPSLEPMEALQLTVLADHFAVPNQTSVTYAVDATTTREGANLTYHWYSNSNLVWVGNSNYSFTLNYSNEGNAISVVVSDGTDSIRHWFTGKVFEPPVIALSPNEILPRPIHVQTQFSIPIAGRDPKTLHFYFGDVLERTITITASNYSWAPLAGHELSSLPIRITASNADGETSWEGQLETLSNPSIVLKSDNALLDAGNDFEFPVRAVTTATGLAFSLEKNGVNLSQAVSAAPPQLKAVQLGDAGTYRVRLGTTLGFAVSNNFKLGVVDDAERQILIAAGGSIQLAARASGPGLNYKWFHNSQPLSDSTEVAGSESAVLQIANVQAAALGIYTCTVSYENSASKRAGHFTVRTTEQPPDLNLLHLPPFKIGEYYHYQIPPELLIGDISFTNLPPGISLNPDGNILSGSPTRLGSYQLLISATNPSGSSLNFVYPITVGALPDHLRGHHVYDYSTANEDISFQKLELRVSDTGHYSAVVHFSKLQGKSQVFRKSGVFQASPPTAADTITKAIWNLPRGAMFSRFKKRIRFYETDRFSSLPRLAMVIEEIDSDGNIYGDEQAILTRAWSELPDSLTLPLGIYNFELQKNQGLDTLSAPSIAQLVFTSRRRALLKGRLGDRQSFVASPLWTPNNTLYFNNLAHGSRSFVRGGMLINKGNSTDDWDTEIHAQITKHRNFPPPVKTPLPGSYTMVWEGVGTRYLPPNTPFLSGPMPFNSRLDNPLYALLMGSSYAPWLYGLSGPLRPNFTGSGYSFSDLRSIEGREFSAAPASIKINPKTGQISGKFWTHYIVEITNDNGDYIRTKRTSSKHSYTGLVTRSKHSTISEGSCQSFLPDYVDYIYTDSKGNERDILVKTRGSQGIFLFVHGQ
jgi:uncharacterized delta-60 repeat protein